MPAPEPTRDFLRVAFTFGRPSCSHEGGGKEVQSKARVHKRVSFKTTVRFQDGKEDRLR